MLLILMAISLDCLSVILLPLCPASLTHRSPQRCKIVAVNFSPAITCIFRAVFTWLSKVIEELVWFWFYYALWLASVFTLVLVLQQSSENRSIDTSFCCSERFFFSIGIRRCEISSRNVTWAPEQSNQQNCALGCSCKPLSLGRFTMSFLFLNTLLLFKDGLSSLVINAHLPGFRIIFFILIKVLEFFLLGVLNCYT